MNKKAFSQIRPSLRIDHLSTPYEVDRNYLNPSGKSENALSYPDLVHFGWPLPSEEGTTHQVLKTFALRMAQVKAGIWP